MKVEPENQEGKKHPNLITIQLTGNRYFELWDFTHEPTKDMKFIGGKKIVIDRNDAKELLEKLNVLLVVEAL